MFRVICILLSSIILNTLFCVSQAFELMQVTSVETSVVKGGTAARANEEAYSTLENPAIIASIISPPTLVKGYIPFNRQVGTLSFSILSPKKTIIYLEWDNVKTLYPRRGKKIKFRRSGEYQSIVFNVTKPSSGYIYLYNSNKSNRKLLRKIPYLIKKQSAYSQSIRSSFIKRATDSDDENSLNMSLSYSINQRVNIGEPRWSAGVRVTSDKSTSVSVSYSW